MPLTDCSITIVNIVSGKFGNNLAMIQCQSAAAHVFLPYLGSFGVVYTVLACKSLLMCDR